MLSDFDKAVVIHTLLNGDNQISYDFELQREDGDFADNVKVEELYVDTEDWRLECMMQCTYMY